MPAALLTAHESELLQGPKASLDFGIRHERRRRIAVKLEPVTAVNYSRDVAWIPFVVE